MATKKPNGRRRRQTVGPGGTEGLIARHILPIPDAEHVGSRRSTRATRHQISAHRTLRPPSGAPNVLIVLIDDVGFGASSAFGGPCHTPNVERLAAGGLRFNVFTQRRSVRRRAQALLTGRNHHSVGMGAITEMATSAPGNNVIRPKSKAADRRNPEAQRLFDRAARQVP